MAFISASVPENAQTSVLAGQRVTVKKRPMVVNLQSGPSGGHPVGGDFCPPTNVRLPSEVHSDPRNADGGPKRIRSSRAGLKS